MTNEQLNDRMRNMSPAEFVAALRAPAGIAGDLCLTNNPAAMPSKDHAVVYVPDAKTPKDALNSLIFGESGVDFHTVS